ncbi:hypothetical protein BDN72DRAFT_301329 [Pluteus cervinus]|uniref:Uncharacterized protein n=1 Tax=Pluteus cervinus TaxID=181527 RepID=A0ACD3ADD5_9AGAR|nr:hypothetical protein BDN72DRAFT_301329 [Pluteus cervinus]
MQTQEADSNASLESDNKELLFSTTLLRGLPRLGYPTYLYSLDRNRLPIVDSDPQFFSHIMSLLVRNEEIGAAIPVAKVRGGYDLIVCCNTVIGSDQLGPTELVLPPEAEISFPTSEALVKDMFIANRGMPWERHANLVFLLAKKTTRVNYLWLARYLQRKPYIGITRPPSMLGRDFCRHQIQQCG